MRGKKHQWGALVRVWRRVPKRDQCLESGGDVVGRVTKSSSSFGLGSALLPLELDANSWFMGDYEDNLIYNPLWKTWGRGGGLAIFTNWNHKLPTYKGFQFFGMPIYPPQCVLKLGSLEKTSVPHLPWNPVQSGCYILTTSLKLLSRVLPMAPC